MPNDVALETLIPTELDEALGKLAAARGTSKATLVREALADYVLSEEAFAAAVEEGRADVRAGRVVAHDDVMREIRELIDSKR
jgi:predicted transcriptional regulator